VRSKASTSRWTSCAPSARTPAAGPSGPLSTSASPRCGQARRPDDHRRTSLAREQDSDAALLPPALLLRHLEAGAGGTHDPDATTAVAWLAAEAIRYLNYASDSDEGVEFASTIYTLAGALSLAASRIPQLASQMRAWLNTNSGRLLNDDGVPVSDTLAAADKSSQATADAAMLLAHHLGQLQSALACTSSRNAPAAGEDSG
jgi:hypothetical protein